MQIPALMVSPNHENYQQFPVHPATYGDWQQQQLAQQIRPFTNGVDAAASSDGSNQSDSDATTAAAEAERGEHRRQFVRYQLEYYFSKLNLTQDTYLKSQMDIDGWVSITLLMGFNQLRKLTEDRDLVVSVIKESQNLELDDSEEKVRPVYQRCVLMLRQVASSTPPEEIKALFGTATPLYTSLQHAGADNWYMTFASEEDAQSALLHLRGQTLNGQSFSVRMKSNTVMPPSRPQQAPPAPATYQPQYFAPQPRYPFQQNYQAQAIFFPTPQYAGQTAAPQNFVFSPGYYFPPTQQHQQLLSSQYAQQTLNTQMAQLQLQQAAANSGAAAGIAGAQAAVDAAKQVNGATQQFAQNVQQVVTTHQQLQSPVTQQQQQFQQQQQQQQQQTQQPTQQQQPTQAAAATPQYQLPSVPPFPGVNNLQNYSQTPQHYQQNYPASVPRGGSRGPRRGTFERHAPQQYVNSGRFPPRPRFFSSTGAATGGEEAPRRRNRGNAAPPRVSLAEDFPENDQQVPTQPQQQLNPLNFPPLAVRVGDPNPPQLPTTGVVQQTSAEMRPPPANVGYAVITASPTPPGASEKSWPSVTPDAAVAPVIHTTPVQHTNSNNQPPLGQVPESLPDAGVAKPEPMSYAKMAARARAEAEAAASGAAIVSPTSTATTPGSSVATPATTPASITATTPLTDVAADKPNCVNEVKAAPVVVAVAKENVVAADDCADLDGDGEFTRVPENNNRRSGSRGRALARKP